MYLQSTTGQLMEAKKAQEVPLPRALVELENTERLCKESRCIILVFLLLEADNQIFQADHLAQGI